MDVFNILKILFIHNNNKILFLNSEREKTILIKNIIETKDVERAKSIILRSYDTYIDFQIMVKRGSGGRDAEQLETILKETYSKINIKSLNKEQFSKMENEIGVHRLIRIRKNKKQTSFIGVKLHVDSDLDISIQDDDLELNYLKSSGPGGQNVNKRSTKVQILYKPLNLIIQNSDTKHQNVNLKEAKAQLHNKVKQSIIENIVKIKNNIDRFDVGKGSQYVRTYWLEPSELIKNERNNEKWKSFKAWKEDFISSF